MERFGFRLYTKQALRQFWFGCWHGALVLLRLSELFIFVLCAHLNMVIHFCESLRCPYSDMGAFPQNIMYVSKHGKTFFSSATEFVREFSSVLIVFSGNNPSFVMSLYCRHYENGSGSGSGWLWGCGTVHGWRIFEHPQSHSLLILQTHIRMAKQHVLYIALYI